MSNYCPHSNPKCYSLIYPFSDASEAFRIATNPIWSLWESGKAAVLNMHQADLCKCDGCGRYSYVCSCGEAVAVSSRLRDATISACPHCTKDSMVRNPNHVLGAPPKKR